MKIILDIGDNELAALLVRAVTTPHNTGHYLALLRRLEYAMEKTAEQMTNVSDGLRVSVKALSLEE